jgi:RimJ/RimL family protein N-acetyltransferase
MYAVIEILRSTPGCQRIQTCYEPTNAVAESLYERLDFCKTGEFVGDEVVVVLMGLSE